MAKDTILAPLRGSFFGPVPAFLESSSFDESATFVGAAFSHLPPALPQLVCSPWKAKGSRALQLQGMTCIASRKLSQITI